MLPTKFRFILQSSFKGEDFFRNRPIRSKNCLWRPCLLMDRDEMCNHKRGLSIDVSYQVSVHLAKRFQNRRILKNRPMRNKNCLWWPCLLMDRDKMSNLYRGPSIDASYQFLYHLAKRFQRKSSFRNRPIKNKNCLWRPCLQLLTHQNGMSNSHRCFLPRFGPFGQAVSE